MSRIDDTMHLHITSHVRITNVQSPRWVYPLPLIIRPLRLLGLSSIIAAPALAPRHVPRLSRLLDLIDLLDLLDLLFYVPVRVCTRLTRKSITR